MKKARLKVNERWMEVELPCTLLQLRDRFKPDADILIYNGHPMSDPVPLREGDEVVFIRRGEIPSKEELEILMMARHTPGVHEKVKAAWVGIAGLGGLGSSVAVALARVGVGHLVIVDYDVVEPSNLNRQQYFVDQIGMPKVEALRDNLLRINPYTDIIAHNVELHEGNITEIFAQTPIVVEAFDGAELKRMLITTILERLPDHVVVAASGVAGYESGNTIRTRRVGRNLFVVGDLESEARPGRGLMAPRVGVAAHHQANTVLRLILEVEDDEQTGQ